MAVTRFADAYLNIILVLLMCEGTQFLITIVPKLENVQDTHILSLNTKYQLRGFTGSLIISMCTVVNPREEDRGIYPSNFPDPCWWRYSMEIPFLVL